MVITTVKLKQLTADEGKILTNGSAYGRSVYLSANDSESNWYEITEEEYLELTKSEEESVNV
jgi:hypothetical protein